MANYNKKISDTCVRLGEVRFSYAHVFEPRQSDNGGEPKYSVCNDLCRPPPGIFLRSPAVTNNKQILYKK